MIPAVESGKPRVSRAFGTTVETAGIEPARHSRRVVSEEAPRMQGKDGAAPGERPAPDTEGWTSMQTKPIAGPGPRPAPPSLGRIALAWEELGCAEIERTFPRSVAPLIGFAEPFCFRCGWLAPTRAATTYPESWSGDRAIGAAWDLAGGWLERAHLHDHRFGGGSDLLNLVPLCWLCHEPQGPCETREAGIAFVNSPPAHLSIGWIIQTFTDANYRNVVKPGRGAVQKMLRAQAAAAVAQGDAFAEHFGWVAA